MSLTSLLNTTVTIQRKSPTKDTSGGQTENYADVSGMVEIPATIQDHHGKAARSIGQRQVFVSHVVYFDMQWSIIRGDRLYHSATGRTFFCHGFIDMGGRQRGFRLELTEES